MRRRNQPQRVEVMSERRQLLLILVLDAVLFAFCMAGVYRATQRAALPVSLLDERGEVVVRRVHDSGGATLRPGNRILAVEGHVVSSAKDVEFVVDALGIGEMATLEILSDGQPHTVSVVLSRYYSTRYLVIQALVGSLFFFLGVFVLARRPAEAAARVFHWASIGVAFVIMATWGRTTIEPAGLGPLLHALFSTANAFVPALFVHFTFVFPWRKWPSANRLLLPLYAFAALLSLAMAVTFMRSTLPLSLEWLHRYLLVYNVTRLFFVGCIAFAVLNFLHSYRTAREDYERKRLRWILLGLTVGPLSFAALWQLPILLGGYRPLPEDLMVLISAIIPITFAISIVRYRILDIDYILQRGTAYVIALAGLLITYVVVVGAVAAVIGRLTLTPSMWVSAAAAVVVALLFEPARRVVQEVVDRHFFRSRYNLREALRRLGEEIRQCIDSSDLAERLVRTLDELLQPERIGFLVTQPSERRLQVLAERNFEWVFSQGARLDLAQLESPTSGPVALEQKVEPGVAFHPAGSGLFALWGIALAYPIHGGSPQVRGYLLLGEKKSGARFSQEDVDLLNSVAVQAGLAMERIVLQRELLREHAETARLEELNRLKSYFVSSVSHELKTPLASIKMFAELLQQKERVSQRELREHLEIIEGETDRLTRLIENVLDFDKLERGIKEYHFGKVRLNDTVRSVLRSFRYSFRINGFSVRQRLCKREVVISADADAIVEGLANLLSNAIKYSRDEKVITVSTGRRDGYAVVEVVDRGVGIPKEEVPAIFEPFYRGKHGGERRGTGLGLTLVRHIMEAHGGKIEVDSTPGKGSRFTLLFPLEAGDEAHPGD